MSDDVQDGDPWWMLSVFGVGYAALGEALLLAARHIANPWHTILNIIGFVPTVAGAWCLLWFVGGTVLWLLVERKHGDFYIRLLLCSVMLAAIAADLWIFLH